MAEITTGFSFPKKRLAMLLYSRPGEGKSTALATLLKVPNLKVRILCTEDNSLQGLQDGLRIHGITELSEGQLTVAQVKGNGVTSSDTFIEQTDDSSYQSAVRLLLNFIGHDVASGKEVRLGNALNWTDEAVLCIDGLTMLQHACHSRGKVKAISAGTAKDPRAAFYAGQEALIGYVYQLLQHSKAHVVVLAHETTSDEVALSKNKGLLATHPALGTRSIVSPFLGRFNLVLYAKINKQTKQYVWSGEEHNTMTVVRNINLKDKTYNGRRVSLNNMPADFSFEGYDFF